MKITNFLRLASARESGESTKRAMRGSPVSLDRRLGHGREFALLAYATATGPSGAKGGVVAARFYDDAGIEIEPPYVGWSMSSVHGAFNYLRTYGDTGAPESSESELIDVLIRPAAAKRVHLEFHPWHSTSIAFPKGIQVYAINESGAGSRQPDNGPATTGGGGTFLLSQQLERHEPLNVSATIKAQEREEEKGGLLLVEFLDAEGSVLPTPYQGFSHGSMGAYRYLHVPGPPERSRAFSFTAFPPADAVTIRLALHHWKADEEIGFADAPTCRTATRADVADLFREDQSASVARVFAQLSHRDGDIDNLLLARARLAGILGTPQARLQLRHTQGVQRELQPDWWPTVPGPPEELEGSQGNRICHLMKVSLPFENTGGAVRNLRTVRSQKEAGLDPYVVTPLGYPRTFDQAPDGLKTIVGGVPHYHLNVGEADVRSIPPDISIRIETVLLAGVLRRFGASLVHATSGYRGYDNALKAAALSRHFGIPYIYEVRSLHEHAWGPSREGILEAPLTKRRIARENTCMQDAHHVVTIANAMKEMLIQRGVDASKITVIPNAVEDEWFQIPDATVTDRLRHELSLNGRRVIGYVSNLSIREGHPVLIEAFRHLAEAFPDLSCLIVGNGSERERLEHLADRTGVGDRILFTGDVPHDEVRHYYRLIDVFVVPRISDFASDYVTPMKPFEAMALGIPLIMSDRPVSSEVVGNEERGLLFRTGDSGHLAARITELLRNSSMADSLIRKARDWVRTERNWQNNAEIYVSLYRELLTRHGSKL